MDVPKYVPNSYRVLSCTYNTCIQPRTVREVICFISALHPADLALPFPDPEGHLAI